MPCLASLTHSLGSIHTRLLPPVDRSMCITHITYAPIHISHTEKESEILIRITTCICDNLHLNPMCTRKTMKTNVEQECARRLVPGTRCHTRLTPHFMHHLSFRLSTYKPASNKTQAHVNTTRKQKTAIRSLGMRAANVAWHVRYYKKRDFYTLSLCVEVEQQDLATS